MDNAERIVFFNDIIKNHSGIFHKISRVYFHNPSDQEDVLQEMRMQVWKALPVYNPEFSLISTWLYRVCLNTAISMYRKQLKKKDINLTQPLDKALEIVEEQGSEKDQKINHLLIFINQLRDLDKALMLLYLEDKSHQEMSEILGITSTNVATKIGRIKIQLKEKFNQINNIES
jgi:RNA polymerase sigma-70 factor (ECF subfamily)